MEAMQIAYWIVAGLLAAGMLLAGTMKTVRSKEQLKQAGMGWTDTWSAQMIKAIGVSEILGAIGLVLPMLTGIAPVLSPIAAICLAITMVGAVVVHVRRSEPPLPPAVLGLLAVAAAVLGFLVILG